MNEVERAYRDILSALIMEYNRPDSGIGDLEDIKNRYALKIAGYILNSSITPWEEKRWLIVARSKDGVAARIKDDAYAAAHARLLEYLGASELSISWEKEEITSDGNPFDGFAMQPGWKWFTMEKLQTMPSVSAAAVQADVDLSTHIFPPPPITQRRSREINWTKWGAIAAIAAVPVAILLWWLSNAQTH